MTRRTPDLEKDLLTGLSEGVPLGRLCRRHGLNRCTVYKWMKDEDFAAQMAWARAIGFDAIAEEALEIADDWSDDELQEAEGTSREARRKANVQNHAAVARARLRIDTRLRLLGRWDPKRYGVESGRFQGMAGSAGMIGRDGARTGGTPAPMDSTAIAVRLSSLLATIAARDPAEDDAAIDHDSSWPNGDPD